MRSTPQSTPQSEAEACPPPVLGWIRKGARPLVSRFSWRKVAFHAVLFLKRSCRKGELKNANEIVKD